MPVSNTLPLAALPAWFAQSRPDEPALICGTDVCSWAELDARSAAVARSLVARGVRPDDMVTIALPNGIDFVVACFAAWKAGATPQPVSSHLPQIELDAIIELARSSAVIAEPGLVTSYSSSSLDELIAASDRSIMLPDHVAASWKAPTSGGSTGRPKIIVATANALCDPETPAAWRFQDGGTAIMPGPLYHTGPFGTTIHALTAGCKVVIMPRFDAGEVLALVDRHRADWLYLVPTMMNRIWKLGDEARARHDLSSLKTMWHLAAPCPAWLKQAWIEWLGGDVIWELYGATEGMAATVINGTEWLEHPGSVGKMFVGSIRILDDAGRELPPGETGELFMRAADPAADSFRYIGAEAEKRDGWQSLGDMGHFDVEGYLYLADRRGDMIIIGGANVYPAEIEAALEEHPQVESCAVIGLPDDDLGARAHAIVQPRGVIDEEALRDFLADRLVRYKRPRSFEFVDIPLRDNAGKVRRSQLRAERIAP